MNKEPSFPQIAVSLVLILMPLSQRRMSQNYKPTGYIVLNYLPVSDVIARGVCIMEKC